MEFFGRPEFEAAAQIIRGRTHHRPRVGLVLGSGLGSLAGSIADADVIPYQDIPYWPHSTVAGHTGQLHIGRLEGQVVLAMQGRAHYYEGYPLSQVTLPIRVMQLLGLEILILTNAAGGINQSFRAADLMLITDHINLVGMAGGNPLRGPNDETLGPRFPSMTRVYDPELAQLAVNAAREHNVPLHQGVYAGLSGPSFETPAEIRFLRLIGADAVGMSTVAEAIVARHAPYGPGEPDRRLRVLGISGITNMAVDDPSSAAETAHEEVLDTGKIIAPRLEAVVRGILRHLITRD